MLIIFSLEGVCVLIFFSRVLADEGLIFGTKPNGDDCRNFIVERFPTKLY